MEAITRRKCQVKAFADTVDAIKADHKTICVTSPTGSGKSLMMVDMIEWAQSMNADVALYTNRRALCEQLRTVLERHGVSVGMRAAGYEPALLRPVQLCMTQTEGSRVFNNNKRSLHNAKLVLIDEAHLQQGETIQKIVEHTTANDGHVVGYTATPLDLNYYDHLVVAGKVSECFAEGSLVPAKTYAPDEPDLNKIKRYQVGQDLSAIDNHKAIMRPGVFGRVYEHWKRLNPNQLPTILFGPDVAGSLWFAEQFWKNGVRAAHVDGSNVWLDGDFIGNQNADAREYVFDLVRGGHVPIICNRFVLREGIDMPELQYGILATVFGALSSYLQSCGRLLRSFPGKKNAFLQDHGGNWHRFGSVNADRDWFIGQTNHKTVGERHERLRQKLEPEPRCCPACSALQFGGGACRSCGFEYHDSSRMVIQVNGTLKKVRGDAYKPRKVTSKSNTEKRWERYYWSQRRVNRTFNQAYAWFRHEEGYWPPKDLPYMPLELGDWFNRIGDVPVESLHQPKAAQPSSQATLPIM